MKTLYYPHQPEAKGFGWATCNSNLWLALTKHFDMIGGDARSMIGPAPDVCFLPVADHNLNPSHPPIGKINLGYCFFESELGPEAERNADQFDTLFCGSEWNRRRLNDRGIMNARTLIQGVDHSIFKPSFTKRDLSSGPSQFRIFSGGKFEWRKGQDLVIRAFAAFCKTHPDAHLVCSWFNPWPELIGEAIRKSGVIFPPHMFETLEDAFAALLFANGIPHDRFTILPQLSPAQLAAEMQNTDVGLFPNRAEGGTNLVMMEYMSCGKAVVATHGTGHADILTTDNSLRLTGSLDPLGWETVEPIEICRKLQAAYELHDIGQLQEIGEEAGTDMRAYTWEKAALRIANEVERSTAKE